MTEHKFGHSIITYNQKEDKPFDIIVSKIIRQELSISEAKQIADFIYENLGLNEKPVLSVKLSDISQQQMDEFKAAIDQSGKNLATFTISK